MRVHVLFFGVLKEIAGRPHDSLELPANARAQDVLVHYAARMPQLKSYAASLAIAVNQGYATFDTELHEGDEVALLPPVSGGSNKNEHKRYASIVRTAIDTHAIVEGLKRREDGAALFFEGIVRNQTRGRKTFYLDYEAYEEMALKEMEALASQALQKFQIRDVAIVHRLGKIEIGETSVLIAVASAHRAAAFDACRWLIDTLKRTVPIWKKEHFEDGVVWADGEPFPDDIAKANS